MRITIIALCLLLAGCGNTTPGTPAQAEAEALNKAAADLDSRQVPPPVLVGNDRSE